MRLLRGTTITLHHSPLLPGTSAGAQYDWYLGCGLVHSIPHSSQWKVEGRWCVHKGCWGWSKIKIKQGRRGVGRWLWALQFLSSVIFIKTKSSSTCKAIYRIFGKAYADRHGARKTCSFWKSRALPGLGDRLYHIRNSQMSCACSQILTVHPRLSPPL